MGGGSRSPNSSKTLGNNHSRHVNMETNILERSPKNLGLGDCMHIGPIPPILLAGVCDKYRDSSHGKEQSLDRLCPSQKNMIDEYFHTEKPALRLFLHRKTDGDLHTMAQQILSSELGVTVLRKIIHRGIDEGLFDCVELIGDPIQQGILYSSQHKSSTTEETEQQSPKVMRSVPFSDILDGIHSINAVSPPPENAQYDSKANTTYTCAVLKNRKIVEYAYSPVI